jgi:hypothetical protein
VGFIWGFLFCFVLVLFFKIGFLYVAQAGLEHLVPEILLSQLQEAETMGLHHDAQFTGVFFLNLFGLRAQNPHTANGLW